MTDPLSSSSPSRGSAPAGPPGPDPQEATAVPRLAKLAELPLTPQRVAFRQMAAAMREIIERLTATDADAETLAGASADLERIAATLSARPLPRPYAGFAELANAGADIDPDRITEILGQVYATFDHSPYIGLANPLSPPVRLRVEGERIVGEVTFGAAYEGPPACVHGGYVAGVFDELLGSAQSLTGAQGMTASLTVDFRSPTPLGERVDLVAWVESREGRKIRCRGEMRVGERLTAECSGLFLAIDRERFRGLLEHRAGGEGPA